MLLRPELVFTVAENVSRGPRRWGNRAVGWETPVADSAECVLPVDPPSRYDSIWSDPARDAVAFTNGQLVTEPEGPTRRNGF